MIGPKLGRNEEMQEVDRDETRWVERPYMTKFTHQTFGGMRLGMWSIHPTGMRYPGEEESGSSHRGETAHRGETYSRAGRLAGIFFFKSVFFSSVFVFLCS